MRWLPEGIIVSPIHHTSDGHLDSRTWWERRERMPILYPSRHAPSSITLFSYLIIVVQYLGLGTSSTAPRPQLGFIEPWTLLRDHKFLYDGWLVPVTTPHLFFPVWGKIPLSQQSHIPFTGCVQQHEPSLPRKAQRAVRSSQYFYYISGDLEDEELKRPLLRLSHCPPRCYMSPIYSKYTLIKDN